MPTTWATRDIEIGGMILDLPRALPATISMEFIGGFTFHRMMNGSLRPQMNWIKRRFEISGESYLPTGLTGIDWTVPQNFKTDWTLAPIYPTQGPEAVVPDYPEVSVLWTGPPKQDYDRVSGKYRWSLTGEET